MRAIHLAKQNGIDVAGPYDFKNRRAEDLDAEEDGENFEDIEEGMPLKEWRREVRAPTLDKDGPVTLTRTLFLS